MKNKVEVITSDFLSKLPHKLQVYFAVYCAKQVTHLLTDSNRAAALKAIEVAELWLVDEATAEECEKAADTACAAAAATYAAGYAAGYAAAAATYAATYAAAAATYAAYAGYAGAGAGAEQKIIQEQWAYYYELLNIDENLEKIMLNFKTDPIFK